MSSRISRRRFPSVDVRLAAEGTRVVVLRADSPAVAGVIRDVRLEPHLKAYVVTCDDGQVVFASGYELAREDDSGATPLCMRPEY